MIRRYYGIYWSPPDPTCGGARRGWTAEIGGDIIETDKQPLGFSVAANMRGVTIIELKRISTGAILIQLQVATRDIITPPWPEWVEVNDEDSSVEKWPV